jgi:hypothetical protein
MPVLLAHGQRGDEPVAEALGKRIECGPECLWLRPLQVVMGYHRRQFGSSKFRRTIATDACRIKKTKRYDSNDN